MISLWKITLKNRRELFRLKVTKVQHYVASNLSSVASCYVLATNGSCPIPFAIYADEQMVGFVMIVYGDTGYDQPDMAKDNYCILRLMIGEQYRITSYNVCYTKLLRIIIKHIQKPEVLHYDTACFIQRKLIYSHQLLSVITSYSIHYTKLYE